MTIPGAGSGWTLHWSWWAANVFQSVDVTFGMSCVWSDSKWHPPWHCHRNGFGESNSYFFACCFFFLLENAVWSKLCFPTGRIRFQWCLGIFYCGWGSSEEGERSSVLLHWKHQLQGGMFLYLYRLFYFECMHLEATITWNKRFTFIIRNTLTYLKSLLIVLFFASENPTFVNPDLECCFFKKKKVEFSIEMNLSSRRSFILSLLFKCWNN